MLSLLRIDHGLARPLQAQLFDQLQELIASGRLKPGARMLATRLLAEQLGISRTTVLLTYERLIAEGYLQTLPSVGTFVSRSLPHAPPRQPVPGDRARPPELPPLPPFCCHTPPASDAALAVDFRLGCPGGHLFPLQAWRRLMLPILERHDFTSDRHGPGGLDCLRRAIAGWLAYNRGLAVAPDEVIVVAGTQQAYDIMGRLFLRPGGNVVIEHPCRPATAMAFERQGGVLLPVAIDESGIDVAQLPGRPAAFAHVTPSHQYPVGGTLPLQRRHRLLDWARRFGVPLLEDDSDGEFRYQGAAPPPLKSLDRDGLVVYAGSFSNTLSPGLRLAYLVVPPQLVMAALTTKMLVDGGSSWLEQLVLARFIDEGGYAQHLRRVRKAYMARRDCLVDALRRHFGEVRLVGTDAGTHITWLLPSGYPAARSVQERARRHGVGVQTAFQRLPGGGGGFADHALFLGYGAVGEQQIAAGVARLARAVAELCDSTVAAE